MIMKTGETAYPRGASANRGRDHGRQIRRAAALRCFAVALTASALLGSGQAMAAVIGFPSNVNAMAGEQIQLPLLLGRAGSETLAGANAQLQLPTGFRVTGVAPGNNAAGFTVDSFQASGSDVASVIVFSGDGVFDTTTEGSILKLTIDIPAGATSGEFDVAFFDPGNTAATSNDTGTESFVPGTKFGSINIFSANDIDGDGLPDEWETQFLGGLDLTADADPDGDGLTNLQEFQLGTDPNVADTDNDGEPDLTDSNPTFRPGLRGDPSGDSSVSILDAQIIARVLAGTSTEADFPTFVDGDVTDDGRVSIVDAQKIAQFLAGVLSSL